MNILRQAEQALDTHPPIPASGGDATLQTMVRPALPRFVLRGVGGAGFGRTFPLVGPTVLGRAPDCGIRLDHPGVSRQHVRLTPTAEGLLVEDLGSTNGWLLNEAPQDRAWARHGDELGIDVLRFRVVAPGVARERAPDRSSPGAGASPWWWVAAAVALVVVAVLVLR
jgi:pSer/pThr/pTyr-binding forkhead associated (FHA) protein